MKCSKCNGLFDDQAKFCPHCGQERLFNPFPSSGKGLNSPWKNRIKTIAGICIAFVIILLWQSSWFETSFGERHEVSGVAISYVQEGNGIEENTYLLLASIDGSAEEYVAVRSMVPIDYFFVGTCVEAGTVDLASAIITSEYPYYIQVTD